MELQTPDRLVRIAVDLVNTRTLDPEQLNEIGDLHTFLLEHGESEPITLDEHDLTEVRAVRERIRPVFHTAPAEAARVLNELLEEYAVRPSLTDHDGSPWHLHVARPDATWGQGLAAMMALGLAEFASGHGFAAIGTCAAVDCERVFVNPAERRPRRFCSPTCSSRTRVASYRARRSSERGA